MARQTFTEGETIWIHQWDNDWRKGVVTKPDVVGRYGHRVEIEVTRISWETQQPEARRALYPNTRSAILNDAEYQALRAKLDKEAEDSRVETERKLAAHNARLLEHGRYLVGKSAEEIALHLWDYFTLTSSGRNWTEKQKDSHHEQS